MASAKKTGGGDADDELTELELKIKSIKGKEIFEGISGGIDLSMESPISPLSEVEMVISPSGLRPIELSSEPEFEMKVPQKRKNCDDTVTASDGLKLLEKEEEKV